MQTFKISLDLCLFDGTSAYLLERSLAWWSDRLFVGTIACWITRSPAGLRDRYTNSFKIQGAG